MKKLINRLICLWKGHEWEIKTFPYITGRIGIEECGRCGKTKKDVIL